MPCRPAQAQKKKKLCTLAAFSHLQPAVCGEGRTPPPTPHTHTNTHPPSPETSPPTASCPLYYPSASSPSPLGNECAWFSALPSLTRKFGRFFSHKLLAAAHISVVLKLSREVFFSAALFFSPPSTKCKAGRGGRVLSESAEWERGRQGERHKHKRSLKSADAETYSKSYLTLFRACHFHIDYDWTEEFQKLISNKDIILQIYIKKKQKKKQRQHGLKGTSQ